MVLITAIAFLDVRGYFKSQFQLLFEMFRMNGLKGKQYKLHHKAFETTCHNFYQDMDQVCNIIHYCNNQ